MKNKVFKNTVISFVLMVAIALMGIFSVMPLFADEILDEELWGSSEINIVPISAVFMEEQGVLFFEEAYAELEIHVLDELRGISSIEMIVASQDGVQVFEYGFRCLINEPPIFYSEESEGLDDGIEAEMDSEEVYDGWQTRISNDFVSSAKRIISINAASGASISIKVTDCFGYTSKKTVSLVTGYVPVEIEPETWEEVETETWEEIETETEAESEVREEVETETWEEIETESEVWEEVETETWEEIETETEAESEVREEVETESWEEIETETETEVESEVWEEVETESWEEIETESEVWEEVETEAESDIETESIEETSAEAVTEPEAETEPETETEPEVVTAPEVVTETEAAVEPESYEPKKQQTSPEPEVIYVPVYQGVNPYNPETEKSTEVEKKEKETKSNQEKSPDKTEEDIDKNKEKEEKIEGNNKEENKGSTFDFSKVSIINGSYLKSMDDIVIIENNKDSLILGKIRITVSRNSECFDLVQGNDYTMKVAKSKDLSNKYSYTIKKEVFDKDGFYKVTIYTEDEAGNINCSDEDEDMIWFYLDTTEPVVVSSFEIIPEYPEDNGVIEVSDNIRLSDVNIFADGEPVKINVTGNSYSFKFPEGKEKADITIVAKDAAGNEVKRVVDNYTPLKLSASANGEGNEQKGSFIAILAVIAAVICLGTFLLLKKRKQG